MMKKRHDPKKHPRYPKGTIINGVNVGGKFMPKEGRGNAAIGKNKLVRAISTKLEKAGKAPSKDANRRIMSAVAKELKAHRAAGGDDDQKTLRRVAQKAIAREVKAIVSSGEKRVKPPPSDRQKRTAKTKQGKTAEAAATPKQKRTAKAEQGKTVTPEGYLSKETLTLLQKLPDKELGQLMDYVGSGLYERVRYGDLKEKVDPDEESAPERVIAYGVYLQKGHYEKLIEDLLTEGYYTAVKNGRLGRLGKAKEMFVEAFNRAKSNLSKEQLNRLAKRHPPFKKDLL